MIWSGEDPAQIEAAAQRLAQGHVLAFPTETVYGLGADAEQEEAVSAVYRTKGRPTDHPLIVHIAQAQDARHFADPIPDFAWALMNAHWPGPLTLILPRRAHVATGSAAGQASIGLRSPSHPVAQALLRAARSLGVNGVAGPSANRFGRVSPTHSRHVVAEFGPGLDVLDGGACEVGIESTIVDCTRAEPVLLRPGMLGVDTLSATIGREILTPERAQTALRQASPKASGTLASHYAPNARLRLLTSEEIEAAAQALTPDQRRRVGVWSPNPPNAVGLIWRAMPADPAQCAQALFQTLRALEDEQVNEIWVLPPPLGVAWDGIRDRLTRASH
jgi:L-threonylcarbamoyladenylate synthase